MNQSKQENQENPRDRQRTQPLFEVRSCSPYSSVNSMDFSALIRFFFVLNRVDVIGLVILLFLLIHDLSFLH